MKAKLEYSVLCRFITITHTKTYWALSFSLIIFSSISQFFPFLLHNYPGSGEIVKEQKGKNWWRTEILIQQFRHFFKIRFTHISPLVSLTFSASQKLWTMSWWVWCCFVFIAGSSQHPLERDLKLLFLLQASEGISCDRLEDINVHPGSIGMKHEFHFSQETNFW